MILVAFSPRCQAQCQKCSKQIFSNNYMPTIEDKESQSTCSPPALQSSPPVRATHKLPGTDICSCFAVSPAARTEQQPGPEEAGGSGRASWSQQRCTGCDQGERKQAGGSRQACPRPKQQRGCQMYSHRSRTGTEWSGLRETGEG